MKITIIANGLLYADNYPAPNQGGSVHTWNLCRELAKRGHEITILRRGKSITLVELGIKLVGVNFKGLESLFKFQSTPYHIGSYFSRIQFSKSAAEFLSKNRPDLIVLIDRFTCLIPLKLNIPSIYIMHSPDALEFFRNDAIHANPMNSILYYIKNRVERHILSNVDEIVVLDKSIKTYLRKLGLKSVTRIPNAIEINHFCEDTEDQNYVLYGGRLDWNKNVDSLVYEFAKLSRKFPDFKLKIVGSGPKQKDILKLISKCNLDSKIELHPELPREKYLDFVKKCSFFVLPSKHETFSVSLIEAMSYGKPVLARKNMGTKDIIKHNENGFIFSTENEFGKYLSKLISDQNLRKEMGKRAKLSAMENFSLKKQTDSYEILFQRIKEKN